MLDPVELLSRDHRSVEAMFVQYAASLDAEVSAEIAQIICDELRVHMDIEEADVYPIVGGELEQRSIEEHAEVKTVITQIEDGADSMGQLEALVKAHVEEEEEAILFPVLAKLDESTAHVLGARIWQGKARAASDKAPKLGGRSLLKNSEDN